MKDAVMHEKQMSMSLDGPGIDEAASYRQIKDRALVCRNCHLWEPATQTVFGEGPISASIMLIVEQPGDKEDIAGRPFIGPAGQKLNSALGDAGLQRNDLYITNAVKHFKFEPRGKIRLHQKPVAAEITACRPWLISEIDIVKPRLIVALGATAAQSLFGKAMAININRGRVMTIGSLAVLITIHPSYLLRIQNKDAADAEYSRFVEDLKVAAASALPGTVP